MSRAATSGRSQKSLGRERDVGSTTSAALNDSSRGEVEGTRTYEPALGGEGCALVDDIVGEGMRSLFGWGWCQAEMIMLGMVQAHD